MTGVLSSFKYPRRGGDRSVGHAPAAVGRGLSLVKRFGAPGHLCLTKHDPTGARGRLTNQSGGLRGFVGSASAGKFKAVKSPHPAQSFLPLGVRPTNCGPGNSTGFQPVAFIPRRHKRHCKQHTTGHHADLLHPVLVVHDLHRSGRRDG